MKKFLFFILAVPSLMFSQVLMQENFDSYALGVVSTDPAGTTAGPSGYYTWTFTGSAGGTSTNIGPTLANFATQNGSTGLKLSGANGTNGGVYVWKSGLGSSWASRTAGNDIAKVDFDITVLTQMGFNKFGIVLYNQATTKILSGMYFDLKTSEIFGLCYYTNPTTGASNNSLVPLPPSQSSPTSEVFNINTLYSLSFTFEKGTGKVTYTVNGNEYYVNATAGAGEDVFELDYLTQTESGNFFSDSVVFDNVIVTAVNTLGVEDIESNESISIVYPNPVKESFTLNLAEKFDAENTNISIVDMNGKLIMTKKYQESINVSDLVSGIYMITISDGTHTENQKLIKE